MSSVVERSCVVCGATEETVRLEKCPICARDFCPDCSYRMSGRRFCSFDCSRAWFWGDDEDEDLNIDE